MQTVHVADEFGRQVTIQTEGAVIGSVVVRKPHGLQDRRIMLSDGSTVPITGTGQPGLEITAEGSGTLLLGGYGRVRRLRVDRAITVTSTGVSANVEVIPK